MTSKRLGYLFILVGPTGAGKNTIMNGVLIRINDLKQLPTATTRPIRPNEKEGREHHFVTRNEFERMIEAGELLEWQNVHGRLYGVPRTTVSQSISNAQDRIADVDIFGALRVRAAFPDNVILIFVQPGSSDDTHQTSETIRIRLHERGESAEEIETRLRRVEMEMSYAPCCDYLIKNIDIEDATQTLNAIIVAERSRRSLLNQRVKHNQPRHPLVFKTKTLAIFGEYILLKDQTLPENQLFDGEYPHETSQRALADFISEPETGFVAPIHISQEIFPEFEALIFWQLHLIQTKSILPDGWSWESLETVNLPIEIRNQLESISY